MLESTLRWSTAQYHLADYGITLRIKRSKLFPDGRLRDPEHVYRTLGRFLVRSAERTGIIPAVDRFDVRVLDHWADQARVAGILGCWTGVRPEHVEMMRRIAVPKDCRYFEVMVPVEDPRLTTVRRAP